MNMQRVENVTNEAQAVLRVLMLDDSDVDRAKMRRFLGQMGLAAEIEDTASLYEFSQALTLGAYDLILIDYHLGEATGIDALDRIILAGNQKDAATIMITGAGRIDLAVEAMRQGCDDFVMKDDLGVEMLQKAIIQSMERRMLMTAAEDNDAANVKLRQQLGRFAGAATKDMKAILSSMLRRTRQIRSTQVGDTVVLDQLGSLEGACNEMWSYLGEFETSITSYLPQKRRSPRLGIGQLARPATKA